MTAYSVSYLFGLITIVLFTSQFAPLLLRVNLREEAERVWRKLGGDGAFGEGQRAAAPALVGRAFRVGAAAGATVQALEQQHGFNLTIERVQRAGAIVPAEPQLQLAADDLILVAGRREAVVAASAGSRRRSGRRHASARSSPKSSTSC